MVDHDLDHEISGAHARGERRAVRGACSCPEYSSTKFSILLVVHIDPMHHPAACGLNKCFLFKCTPVCVRTRVTIFTTFETRKYDKLLLSAGPAKLILQ